VYPIKADPTTTGLLANVAAVHLEIHPDHALTYTRETLEEATARRDAEAEVCASVAAQTAEAISEHQRLTEARRRRTSTALPGRLYIPGGHA
jgi:hypothetical protein